MNFSIDKNFAELQRQDGVFNACDKTVANYTVEFNVTEYYKDGSVHYPNSTFATLQEAMAYAKEISDYNNKIIYYVEIDMETTAWYITDEDNENDTIPDTIGDVTVCYYKRAL